jgi:hypothetical protein
MLIMYVRCVSALGHMLTYMLTAHARTRTCPVLLQLTRQEADELGGVDGVYLDRKGVKRRTGLSASAALSSAPGSPRSSLETNPVARIACPSSPKVRGVLGERLGVPVPLEDDALGLMSLK